eukprot:SAG31_NODE_945_length_10834_cov_16.777084_10_plen_85_part_00
MYAPRNPGLIEKVSPCRDVAALREELAAAQKGGASAQQGLQAKVRELEDTVKDLRAAAETGRSTLVATEAKLVSGRTYRPGLVF